jgi:hypothetical protein
MNISDLRNLVDAAGKATLAEASEAVAEEREVRDVIQGYEVVTKYSGTEGRGTVIVFSDLFVDGKPFGYLRERHPWSIFESITSYLYFGFHPLLYVDAISIANELFPGDVGDGKLLEVLQDPYEESYGYFATDYANIEVMLAVFWRQSKLPADRRPVIPVKENHERNSKKSSAKRSAK